MLLIHLTKVLATIRALEITEILRIALQTKVKDGNLSFDSKTNTEIFKDFYLNLADNVVKKLPSPSNKFEKETVKTYYQRLNPILDGVRAHPILDGGGGKKAPRVNSAI